MQRAQTGIRNKRQWLDGALFLRSDVPISAADGIGRVHTGVAMHTQTGLVEWAGEGRSLFGEDAFCSEAEA